MFITMQFPFVDLRPFLLEPPYFVPGLLSPEQNSPLDLKSFADRKYIRCFGHYKLRGMKPELENALEKERISKKKKAYQPNQSDAEYGKLPIGDIWQDEYLYASCRRGLRFDQLEKQDFAAGKLVYPRIKQRALRFSPYEIDSKGWSPCMRIETGILFDVPKGLDGNELIKALIAFTKLKTRVPVYKKEGAGKQAIVEKPIKLQQGTLIEQNKNLAKLIVNGTTAQNIAKVHPGMVSFGEPLMAVHYAPDEIISLPSTVVTLPKTKTGGATISYCPLKNSNMGIWLFELPYAGLNNKTAVAKREAIRNNTIAILRYWSELQAAIAVRNVVLSNAFGFSKKGNDLLERYIKEINSFLFSAKWHGAPMDMIRNIIDAYQSAIPDNFGDIEKALKAFRRQIGQNFMKIGMKKPGIFVSYSHKDAAFLDDIRETINARYQTTQITYFDDTFIKPGEEWDPKIKNALENATIAVLLVSDNFLKSEYIQTIEQKKLVDLYQRQKTKIILLLLDGKVPGKGSLSPLNFINANQPLSSCSPAEKQNILLLLQSALEK